ncbi:HsdR family type I site-specific deoxyribonuclease [Pasteurella multocida]|uniref:type I restriction endonuclease subunit R n=1 Tax=Pasteurella multocida TaxID=747 RepID=UPI0009F1BE7D|nr:HsdR family type I site-specific deoxyribonuclease [Pasteurella multocida]MEB3450280.1 HsdR family type I site-specific deoxyribonuclease [Pasteurella multocida]MEB3452856.1 HsdR family type I site-specific deoxyribonuclease [Pasteurella multocida]MEB3454459.1 HsdR family type I site-specific deoxyribonuclease [Pasteurella multocida]MEB3458655.1 HsdR family type I site-specific deoxyribonuclease [Pasteurella multocida]MEB3460863.1 HsdR family type I site-specific deoxyribonuclease [Pasteure
MTNKMPELVFEKNLIEYLCTGTITSENSVNESSPDYIVRTKLWRYEPTIKTTEDLWANFKQILERLNQKTLERPLSTLEFEQVKRIISNLSTPYAAGQFLYGTNGISQIEIDLDDDRHVFLTVFDQKQIGAGDTTYQIVNQIRRPAVIAGKENRCFDTTLLINGLPIIQIEEKKETRDINEALNQMHQYIAEHQYSDIYSTLQILVAITPNNVKYMANTTADRFNKDFAFNWQRQSDNKPIYKWKEFADSMLSIPMAHQMATNYMILDGTPNKQALKVMRPYQVYATRNVMNKLKKADFSQAINKLGYIWHTTGSGKTITSFKTAWLASRAANVDKVVFLVDRIALTNQTNENYQAYDPDTTKDDVGTVQDTKNTTDLNRKLHSKGSQIIITSVQKLDTLVKRASFKAPNKNILFIVDEAHRSTGSENFQAIQKAFKHSAWIGYTGTPMFDETTNGLRTEDIFGELLHAYTIREAIADRNVLGFKVDFETTISEESMKKDYLPKFYRQKYPTWTEQQITQKIENLTQQDMDDSIEPSFYDENPEHVELVVKDIFKHWKNRSNWDNKLNRGRYNAMLTTHIGGGKASTPMAMMYFREFQRVNKERSENGEFCLKVAVTFSQNNTNNDAMLENNQGLFEAIQHYNAEFGTNFSMSDVSAYTEDVASRLNRTATDKQFLDLVIVVDQLLTGFDAPELNTLYVDRTLKGAGLIQAYSRTNRVADMREKPWGRVINYRWPAHNENLMNEALSIYANKDSAQLSSEERKTKNTQDNITAPKYQVLLTETKEIVKNLREITDDFSQLPPSEAKKWEMFEQLKTYTTNIAKLKQYSGEDENGEPVGFDYDNPDKLIEQLGMSGEEESMLTNTLTNELKLHLAKKKNIPVAQIELKMTHVKDVEINYDYLTELIETLIKQVEAGETEKAIETEKELQKFANGLEDRSFASRIFSATKAIMKGLFGLKDLFNKPKDGAAIVEQANLASQNQQLLAFRLHWGLTEIITNAELTALFSRHQYQQKDLDDNDQLTELIKKAGVTYTEIAQDNEIKALSKMKYRNQLRNAIYQLADEFTGE